jgi:hypothetical protein
MGAYFNHSCRTTQWGMQPIGAMVRDAARWCAMRRDLREGARAAAAA